jgi:gliding motility-associated lipoprotein GldD
MNQLKLIKLNYKILSGTAIAIFFTGIIGGCNSTYTSKKTGYFKIDFPKREYQKFDEPTFPYTFEYPVYATVEQGAAYFDSLTSNPYSINIDFPAFNGKVYISYKVIGGISVYKVKKADGGYRDSIGKNSFEKMVDDCYNLTYKNDIKAYSIEDSVMRTPNDITGVFFRLGGNVATAKQFFLSDSVHNFLRGALYFDATPNEDSLQPVNDFLQKDMKHIINTLKWKQPAGMLKSVASVNK